MTLPKPLSVAEIHDARNVVASNFETALETLSDLVRIPGIAWEAFDANNLERSAEAVANLLRQTGIFDFVEIRRAKTEEGKDGAPAVLARRAAQPGKPQILLYAHHDVQPPGDPEQWQSEPFEPTILGGRMYGRGAADDKAGIVAHLTAIESLKNLLAHDLEQLGVGITVFIEGEEEAGSPSFRNFLEDNKAELASDVIIVADSGNWTTEVPAITTALRGMVSQVIEVSTLDHAVHSGMYGGVVPDAMLATIKLLATLHDEKGKVAVSGLVSNNKSDLPYTDEDLRRDSGLLDGVERIGEGSILDGIWHQPAITVIGIDGQSVALSSNTLLPKVRAKISMRIAPGEVPSYALELLRKHLLEHVPFGAKIEFGEIEMGSPFEVDASGWAKQTMERALSDAFGEKSVDIGIGGSIPFIADLTELFPSAQILVTGVEDSDSRAHSPNESLHLQTLQNAILAETLFLLNCNTE